MRQPTEIAVASDEAVFADLYPRLRRFSAVVGPIEVEPDDLVQEALERTLRCHTLASLDDPLAYLMRVIVNLASNHRRRLARARKALARLMHDEETMPEYPSDVAELMQIGPVERAILVLHEIEGYPYREVAALLGMGEEAVSKAAQRARVRLLHILEGARVEDGAT